MVMFSYLENSYGNASSNNWLLAACVFSVSHQDVNHKFYMLRNHKLPSVL